MGILNDPTVKKVWKDLFNLGETRYVVNKKEDPIYGNKKVNYYSKQ